MNEEEKKTAELIKKLKSKYKSQKIESKHLDFLLTLPPEIKELGCFPSLHNLKESKRYLEKIEELYCKGEKRKDTNLINYLKTLIRVIQNESQHSSQLEIFNLCTQLLEKLEVKK